MILVRKVRGQRREEWHRDVPFTELRKQSGYKRAFYTGCRAKPGMTAV
jgi:hypothetical protein